MKLFSKRYLQATGADYRRFRDRGLVKDELRNRLAAEIDFLSSRDDFLEFFILFENQKKEKIFLDENKVDGFSLAELGYKMSDFFSFEKFAVKEQSTLEPNMTFRRSEEVPGGEKTRTINFFDDYKLFDLIEFIILFSKKDVREIVIKRFGLILLEEESEYEIVNGMITKRTGETIMTLTTLLKDDNLKKKLEDYAYNKSRGNYINMAKISAEILNTIFSDEIPGRKKAEINKILQATASTLTTNPTHSTTLFTYLGDHLVCMKNFINNIYGVRHTEKSTIQVVNGEKNILYKMIAEQNMSIIEVVLIALKDDFVFSEDWENTKDEYIAKYHIDRNIRYTILRPIPEDDVPF